jgi:fibronectin type 3 domain-containing protein
VNETGGAIEVFEPPKAGDVTGDGLLDIIAVTVPGDIYIYNQSYSLVEHVKQPDFYGGSAMTLVQDVDGDGRNELIVTSSQGVTLCYDTPAPTPNPKPRTDKSFYSEARRGAAEYVPAPIPVSPTLNLEWPVNTATNQARNPTLSVKVADFQQNPMTITFSTNASGSWTTIDTRSGGNNIYSVATSGMNQYGRKYYWRVTASDGSHSTTETYSFTTLSTPPTQGTPSLVVNGGSLVASNVSTGDANGDAVDNIYSWYVDDVPYTNLYLPFDSRDSNNPMITETVFSDGFESGWGNWASYDSWTRVTSERYSGSYSAYAGESATYLTSDNIDISAGEGLTLSFWYRDDDIDDDDNVLLQFWNGTTYHDIFELGNTEPEDTWHFYSAQTFRATFNSPDFHFRFSASSIDAGEGLWIDDLSIVVPSRTKDYSGYANDATIHGAQWTSDGVVGGAYVFDGRTDYMRIPDVSSLDGDGSWNELSIEFWVKPLSESRGARIIAKKVAGDSTGEYMVGFQTSGSPTNTLFFGVYNGSSWQDTWSDANTHLAAGNWYHVVCTYESGPGLKIYINGTLRNSKALTGPIFNDDVSVSVFGSPLFIGQDGSGDQSRRFFNGLLDEVKIYRRALSADQIMQDYVEAGSGQSSRATIVPAETVEDEVWRCGVTPNDSFGDGLTVLSNPVTVGAPPAQYGLLVETRGSGTTNATGAHTYSAGTVVTVQATPGSGWTLSYWLLNGTNMGSVNPYVVVMSQNRNLTAVFVAVQYGLLVKVGDSGGGITNATGTTMYPAGTTVKVLATPDPNWVLSKWLLNGTDMGATPNPFSVTMSENRNLTAVFAEKPKFNLLVEVSGSGSTNATGTTLYDSGTVVAVQATHGSGWTLGHWLLNGTNVGSVNPYSVTMTENRNLTAVFIEVQYELLVEVSGSGITNATGTVMYDSGTVVHVLATPSAGWTLNKWLLNGSDSGSANPCTLTMTANYNLTAIFTESASSAFDFGTGSSPVESGYVQVTESTAYSAVWGYGWDSTAGLDSRDRSAPNNLERDLVFSDTDHTFNVDLANGQYKVTLTIGDNDYTHDVIDVYAENVLKVDHLTVYAGTFSTQVFTVMINDGQLNVKFHDAGGSDPNWVIDAIKVEPFVPIVQQFDFGSAGSPVESGYVQVTESTAYSAVSGYGWESTVGLDSRDRGAPDNLERDFVFSSTNHTFNVDLANGQYKVTLTIGDNDYTHDVIDVYAEDVLQVNHLTVNAGTFATQVFTVAVGDGQLNIGFNDAGGPDLNWVINAITIEPAT